jgi:hypothetical protein
MHPVVARCIVHSGVPEVAVSPRSPRGRGAPDGQSADALTAIRGNSMLAPRQRSRASRALLAIAAMTSVFASA